MSCNIGSINQIHKCLNENGFAISKRFLRHLVDDGQLPYMKSGNKYLINYDTTVGVLCTLTAVPEQGPISA